MRNHQTTAALMRIAGSDRGVHSPHIVAGAECELRLRTGNENELFLRKISRFGAISALLGVMAFISSSGFLFVFASIGMPSNASATDSSASPSGWMEILFIASACFQAISGILLFSGGIGLRSRSHWAPSITAIPIIYAMCCTAVSAIAIGYSFLSMTLSGPIFLGVAFSLFATANTAFWLFLLWMPLRFVLSPRVKYECR